MAVLSHKNNSSKNKKKADCTFSALIKEINQKIKNKIIENLQFPNAKTLIKIG